MKSAPRLKSSFAGVLAAGALLTGTAGVIGAGLALSAGPAHATPEVDCAAVRARDHQIYLNLIASLPPGAPIPLEYINPCLTAPYTTATAAPTTTVGLPGAQAPGGVPNVGANAPTNFPTDNGTPIVPRVRRNRGSRIRRHNLVSRTLREFRFRRPQAGLPRQRCGLQDRPHPQRFPAVVPDRSLRIRIRIPHRPKRFRIRQQMSLQPGRTRGVTGISNSLSSALRRSPLRASE